MNTRRIFPHLMYLLLIPITLLSACTATSPVPAMMKSQAIPTQTPPTLPSTLVPPLPTATLRKPIPFASYPGGHATTTWRVEANPAFDALCFIPTLTGDPFYLKFYQSDYNRFAPQLTPVVQQALNEIREVVKQHDSLLSSILVGLFLPSAPQSLADLTAALDNPESIRLGTDFAENDETWLLIMKHIPNLQTIIRWMQDVGFEQYYTENVYPGIQKRAEQLNVQLAEYNIIPVVEAALGQVLPSNQFTMYLAQYPLPFGLGLDANVSLFFAGLPLSGIVDNSIHENLHLIDIQEKELWDALSFLQNDAYYMNNFKIHDPSGGYMLYEQFLEEDVIEALDQYLIEQFTTFESPRSRWGSQPIGTHTLSPVLYTLLKQENYSPQEETYHDFVIRMVQEGKLKAGMIEEANHQFYAQSN